MAKINFKIIFWIIIILITLILFFYVIKYNYQQKTKSLESGIFIDLTSSTRGVSVNQCHLDSIEEVIPGLESEYWFGCDIINYSSPVFLKIYFPFNLSISSYGSCCRSYNNSQQSGNDQCLSFPARVIGNSLEIVYNNETVPYMQLKIRASLFQQETPDKFVFKVFQIRENPLPFMIKKNLNYDGNNIVYSLKLRRETFNILSAESNFIPQVQNELTGDYQFERLVWKSEKMPGEGILFISNNNELKLKTLINLFGILVLGIFIGTVIDKLFKRFLP